MDIIRKRPDAMPGPPEFFSGHVWVETAAIVDNDPQHLNVLKVHFAPGARTAWHSHPAGQVLQVLEGTGRVQERGEPLFEMREGDTVITAPEVWHWHGASPGHFMIHLAIQQPGPNGAQPQWGEHVSEADYNADVVSP
jgi:quercetin dioxygenase-like cupin family protein